MEWYQIIIIIINPFENASMRMQNDSNINVSLMWWRWMLRCIHYWLWVRVCCRAKCTNMYMFNNIRPKMCAYENVYDAVGESKRGWKYMKILYLAVDSLRQYVCVCALCHTATTANPQFLWEAEVANARYELIMTSVYNWCLRAW